MKITCPYCNHLFNDTLEKCPHCGSPNSGVVRTSGSQPITIEELQKWYQDRGLPPYEVTRFFIGQDYQSPRAFGIYQDQTTGDYVVYKNKDNGQRAIRYQGTDEAYAVNELYQRLKQEIIEQKQANINRKNSQNNSSFRNGRGTKKKRFKNKELKIFALVWVLFFIIAIVMNQDVDPSANGYYDYQGMNYYHIYSSGVSEWYYYDEDDTDWYRTYEVPQDLEHGKTSKDFYYTPTWDASTQITDFTSSSAYASYQVREQRRRDEENSRRDDHWDNDDSGYDWDSNDSWDSGGSDWDSDW